MARKKSNAIDKARQALTRSFLSSVKATSKSAKRAGKKLSQKSQQIQRQRESDFVAKWRELKKLGIINTKNNPSKKHLTKRLKTKINKEFYAFQAEGQYVKGKTIRPLIKETIKTKRGERIKYTLSDHFKFLRTKKKTDVQTGILKTSKGYIIQKRSSSSNVTINAKGDIVEKIKGVRFRSRGYKGDKILELYAAIKENRLKLGPKESLGFKIYGSQNYIETFDKDNLDLFLGVINKYIETMPSNVFQNFLDSSEVIFIRG